MSIEQIGKANANDQPQLHRLWETVFGDPPEVVQAFFDRFPPEISGWVLRIGDRICSAAYLIPGNWYVSQQEMRPAAYVYAVATNPSMRKKGYAGRLMQSIAAFAEERNLLLYTRPAEQSLFPWYASTLQTENIGFLKIQHYEFDNTISALPCHQITASEYGAKREQLLSGVPHLALSENFLRLQESYSDGFYSAGDSCCCVIKGKNEIQIPEIMISDLPKESVIQSLVHKFRVQSAMVQTVGSASDQAGIAYTGKTLPSEMNWGFFLE